MSYKIPNLSRAELEAILKHHGLTIDNCVTVIGIRGYFLDSKGLENRNDLNIYDDVIGYISPRDNGAFAANTDPSFAVQGGKALAKLNLGVYKFTKGHHKKVPNAFRAFPEGVVLPCTRNGKPSTCSAINIHPGGNGTWSAGCQTFPPENWAKFQPEVYSEMIFYKQQTFNYILIENREIGGKQAFYDSQNKVISI